MQELKPNVYSIRAIDWDRRLFDELIPLPEGTTYNAYLVEGSEKTALLDTVDPTKTDVLLGSLTASGIEARDMQTSNLSINPNWTGYDSGTPAISGYVAANLLTVNLGTGRGYSVLEMIETFAAVSGRAVPYRIAPRRPGDVAACYAQVSQAARRLGGQARRGLREMCASAWQWQVRLQENAVARNC